MFFEYGALKGFDFAERHGLHSGTLQPEAESA
jgi:hypothetical protein